MLPAATRPTMIDVEVDEDWTATVTNTPIITPTTGFWNTIGQRIITNFDFPNFIGEEFYQILQNTNHMFLKYH